MVPIKSVSGVIGTGTNVRKLEYTCGLCTYENCYRKRKHR
ncbi:methionine synthase, partial [Bacteroides thetaiotaomicron]